MSVASKLQGLQIFYINKGDEPIVKKPIHCAEPEAKVRKPPRPWWDKMLESLTNAAIAGILAFISILIVSEDWSLTWKAGLIAAGIAFSIEMRKYLPKKRGG